MTSTMIKDLSKSALLKPIFLILLAIVLLLAPASAFAEGDESPASDSNSNPAVEQTGSTNQSGGFEIEISAPTGSFDNPADFDQDLSVNSSNSGADFSVDISSVNPDSTGINDTPALETPAPPPPDAPSAPAENNTTGNSYVATITPDVVVDGNGSYTDGLGNAIPNTGSSSNFTVTFTELSQLTKLGSAQVEIPAGFTITSFNPADITAPVGKSWDGELSGAFFYLWALNEASYLGANESVSVIFTATTPDTDNRGVYTFETKAWTDAAAEFGGVGSTVNNMAIDYSDPVIVVGLSVSNADELHNVRNNLDGYYIQTSDIDLNGGSYNNGNGWIPIGNDTVTTPNFTGTYNGSNYKISNLGIDTHNTTYIGLFGYTGVSAKLMNIKLENVVVPGNKYVGGLVGCNLGTISNSYVKGTVTGNAYVGGMVGTNGGTIVNSYADVNVTGNDSIGGLVGSNADEIFYNNEWTSVSPKIVNCYATGTVTGTPLFDSMFTGGLVGKNFNIISNCYANGNVTGFNHVGGLAGYNVGTISKSFYDSDTTGQSDTGKGDPKTTLEMQTLATYDGWNIAGVDGSYPVLGWQVNWKDNIWYMGTPPGDTPGGGGGFGGFSGIGGFFNLGFTGVLPIQTVADLTPITGRVNVLITPGTITTGSWFDLYQASAAYQAALLFLENNGDTLSPAERALLEVELAIVKAALLAMEARLLAAEGLPYDLAALQTAYAEAMATFNANQSFLNGDQLQAANQLLAAIAGVIAALQ